MLRSGERLGLKFLMVELGTCKKEGLRYFVYFGVFGKRSLFHYRGILVEIYWICNEGKILVVFVSNVYLYSLHVFKPFLFAMIWLKDPLTNLAHNTVKRRITFYIYILSTRSPHTVLDYLNLLRQARNLKIDG